MSRFPMRFLRSPISASKTPTITVSSANSPHLLTILSILTLQNGQLENLKKVKITLFPLTADRSNWLPSKAGSEKTGITSPTESLAMLSPLLWDVVLSLCGIFQGEFLTRLFRWSKTIRPLIRIIALLFIVVLLLGCTFYPYPDGSV